MKHTQGEWKSTFSASKERGVRTGFGFICFLPKPTHYTGQDERYERELEENKADAKIIAAAPELLGALLTIKERFDECMDLPINVSELYDSFYQDVINEAIKKATS